MNVYGVKRCQECGTDDLCGWCEVDLINKKREQIIEAVRASIAKDLNNETMAPGIVPGDAQAVPILNDQLQFEVEGSLFGTPLRVIIDIQVR